VEGEMDELSTTEKEKVGPLKMEEVADLSTRATGLTSGVLAAGDTVDVRRYSDILRDEEPELRARTRPLREAGASAINIWGGTVLRGSKA